MRSAETGPTIWGEVLAEPVRARKAGLLPSRKPRARLFHRVRNPMSGAQIDSAL